MSRDLTNRRREYTTGELRRSQLDEDPVRQFTRWFDEGSETAIEPSAMVLATADGSGRPSARMVLLKSYDEQGFVFATNYLSRKALEINVNPKAALLLFWPVLERQIRITGEIELANPDESDAIFMARPRRSRIAAIASQQSAPIASRDELEFKVAQLSAHSEGLEVIRPQFWGGYRVRPEEIEFWQGRRDRLHDRFVYRREPEGWGIERLQP